MTYFFVKRLVNAVALPLLLLALVTLSVQAQDNAANYKTGKRYDLGGQLTGVILPDPDGTGGRLFNATRNTYNAQGLLEKIETGFLYAWPAHTIAPKDWESSGYRYDIQSTSLFTYDDWGRKTSESTQNNLGITEKIRQFSYDERNRLKCDTVRMNILSPHQTLATDPCSNIGKGTHGHDRITLYEYDTKNRMTAIRKAYLTPLAQYYARYSYNSFWEKEGITDANGNRATLYYDHFGRLSRWVFPSKTNTGSVDHSDYEEYGYDHNDNRTSHRKRDGQILYYSFDPLNRVTVKDLPAPASDVHYAYNNAGLQTQVKFGSLNGQGITTQYTGFGEIKSSTNNLLATARTIHYQYDKNGNRTRITHPSGIYFQYDYDGVDLLTGIRENSTTTTPILTAAYHQDLTLASVAYGGGALSSYGYDGIGRLARLEHNFSGTASDVVNSFRYNPANQMTERDLSNSLYAYTGDQNQKGAYVVNGLNQYTSVNGKTFSYDARGNLTSDGASTYTYDVENRLTQVSGAKTATLKYDPLGRLYEFTANGITSQFLYDGDALIAEYSSAGTLLRSYGHGSRVDNPVVWYEGSGASSANRRYLHNDHQGSIIAVSNPANSVIKANTYDTYGIPHANNLGRFSYTGQLYLSEIGLHYYKARIYSAALGRFLQTDPVGYEDQMNLYAYVHNDPVNYNDSTGEFAHIAIGALAGGLISGIAYAMTADNFNAKDLAINMASGAAVGAVTAAVPGAIAAGSLNFGSKAANIAVSAGNATAAGVTGSAASQVATTGDIDTGKALVSGVANAVGAGVGAALAKPAAVAATVKTAGSPGLPVTSLKGNTFMVGKVNPTSVTSQGAQQTLQDVAGETASALINEATPCLTNGGHC